MKILHFITIFSLPSETFIYDFILNQQLKESFVKQAVLCFQRTLKKQRPLSNLEVIEKYPRFYKRYFLRLLGFSLKKRVISFLERCSPDLIQAHIGVNGIEIFQLLQGTQFEQTPILVSLTGTDATSLPFIDPVYRKNFLALAAAPQVAFTVNSVFLKNKLLSLGVKENKIHIVYNMFNPAFQFQPKTLFFKQGDTLRLISVARLTACKGHKYLLEAFKIFSQHYPNTVLTLAGGGELEQEIRQQIHDLGIESKVNMLGMVPHQKLPDILAAHDVYLHPAIITEDTREEEAFGISILEAIAAGLPVIASAIGGIPEVIGRENKHAFLVAEKDITQIVEKLKMMVSTDYEFSSNAAYAHERTTFYSMENYLKRMNKVYQEILQ
ncbi:glycosyltransferase [Hugenholtzia roseola]|uniref:glycosyltransferase n=1 Tax=Hugenholtzia roseola TaxID=1002 RepID=UPI00041A0989|nr:glycosyltransferase [Hugenholtzia roseola]